jgi:hypothetical protein
MLTGLIVTINSRVLPVAVPMCLAVWVSEDVFNVRPKAEAEIFRCPFAQLEIPVNVFFFKKSNRS